MKLALLIVLYLALFEGLLMAQTHRKPVTCHQKLGLIPKKKGSNPVNTKNELSREEVMKKFDLVGHPEGGYFRQTYIKKSAASNGESLDSLLPQATAIYFMITGDNFSAWHRVPHDEIFHFYQGESVEFLMITPDGELKVRRFGSDIQSGDEPQIVVPGGTWQAFRILNPNSNDSWSLMGTTMSPGFQFETFEIGSRDAMLREFPEHREIIEALTRE